MSMQKLWCVAAFAAFAAFIAPGLAEAQGLADVAKREKQRQAKERAKNGEAKVHTESAGGTTSPAPESGAATAPSPAPEPRPRNAAGSTNPRPRVRSEMARERAYRNVSVTLYVTSWCQFCQRAREFLAGQPNVRVEVHDIEANQARHKEMLSKTGGAAGVPVIDVEGIILKGYSAEAISRALARVRGR